MLDPYCHHKPNAMYYIPGMKDYNDLTNNETWIYHNTSKGIASMYLDPSLVYNPNQQTD